MQELDSQKSRLHEANTVATSLGGVMARLQGELANSREQGEHHLSALQTGSNSDQDMLHSSVRDLTHVELLMDAERQKRRNIKRLIADWRGHISHHSSLVDCERTSLHSDMHHAYETCLRSLLSEVAESIRDCGTEYDSDVDTQLKAYESSIQQRIDSILAILYHILEDIRRGDAPDDSQ